MHRAPRRREDSLFADGVGIGAVWQGGMFAVMTLIAYFVGATLWKDTALGGTMAFAVLAMGQLVHAMNLRSTHSLFKVGLHTNRYMIGAFFASLLLLLAVLLIPTGRTLFSLVAMNAAAWGVVVGLALVPLVTMELYKLITHVMKRK